MLARRGMLASAVTPSPSQRLRRAVAAVWSHRVDLTCGVILTLTCAVHLSSLEWVVDLPAWDEADYLRIGVAWPRAALPDPEWGPLYALWYSALARVVEDPVRLFYESYRLLIALPALALYVCVRRFGASPVISLAGATAFLLGFGGHVIPRSSLLALLVVLTAVALLSRVRTFTRFAAGLALALLVASLARPELFLSFVILAGMAFVSLALHVRKSAGSGSRQWLRAAPSVCSWLAFVLVILALAGNPMSDRSNRRRFAFCQHFALGEVQRQQLDLEPWGQCEAVLARTFGSARSVGEAAASNPKAFATHALHNLAKYPLASIGIFLREFDHAFVHGGAWVPIRQMHALTLLTLLGGALLAIARRSRGPRGTQPWRTAVLSEPSTRAAAVAFAVLVPTAASSILIWPREHYLVLQGVTLFLLIVAVISSLPRGVPSSRLARLQSVARSR